MQRRARIVEVSHSVRKVSVGPSHHPRVLRAPVAPELHGLGHVTGSHQAVVCRAPSSAEALRCFKLAHVARVVSVENLHSKADLPAQIRGDSDHVDDGEGRTDLRGLHSAAANAVASIQTHP